MSPEINEHELDRRLNDERWKGNIEGSLKALTTETMEIKKMISNISEKIVKVRIDAAKWGAVSGLVISILLLVVVWIFNH